MQPDYMIHLPNLIIDLGLVLGAAAIITILFRWLRQPLVLGYLIAGFLVGPHFTLFPTVAQYFHSFGQPFHRVQFQVSLRCALLNSTPSAKHISLDHRAQE